MGMTQNQLHLIRCIAENKLAEAKKIAIACCTEDNTKKNQYLVKRYKNMLTSQSTDELTLPPNLSGICSLESLENYRVDRYYLSESESLVLGRIIQMRDAALTLDQLGIPYVNSVMLTGESGTGKTAFARYIAKKLELPFLYINFSWLIDSLLGKTAKNLQNVFQFARTSPCVLMLDEMDCIARKRADSPDGAGRELGNTTITLIQELDRLQNTNIVIGATNLPETIDHAIMRRFSVVHDVKKFDQKNMVKMLEQYLSTVPYGYKKEDLKIFCEGLKGKPQGVVLNALIERIAESIINKEEIIRLNADNDR